MPPALAAHVVACRRLHAVFWCPSGAACIGYVCSHDTQRAAGWGRSSRRRIVYIYALTRSRYATGTLHKQSRMAPARQPCTVIAASIAAASGTRLTVAGQRSALQRYSQFGGCKHLKCVNSLLLRLVNAGTLFLCYVHAGQECSVGVSLTTSTTCETTRALWLNRSRRTCYNAAHEACWLVAHDLASGALQSAPCQ